jgi:hypothetical protein
MIEKAPDHLVCKVRVSQGGIVKLETAKETKDEWTQALTEIPD